ncbi:substrate-binding domain-containing protein [Methylosinus sp.]|uniref:substrate-binding domain-containing protein n=1 Tax=Methylosinus sp. TaxID=427 RepID=UPI0039C9630B
MFRGGGAGRNAASHSYRGHLTGALRAIVARYRQETGEKIDMVFGPSGLLREGIEKGSDADLFLSADRPHPKRLAEGRKGDGASRFHPQHALRHSARRSSADDRQVSRAHA